MHSHEKRSRSRRWIIGITLLGVLSFGFYRWAVPAPMTPNPALRTWQAGGEQWGVQWTALPGMQFIQSEGEMLGWFDNNGVPALGRNRERTPWLPPKGRYANARVADGMIYVLYWRRGAPSEMLAFEEESLALKARLQLPSPPAIRRGNGGVELAMVGTLPDGSIVVAESQNEAFLHRYHPATGRWDDPLPIEGWTTVRDVFGGKPLPDGRLPATLRATDDHLLDVLIDGDPWAVEKVRQWGLPRHSEEDPSPPPPGQRWGFVTSTVDPPAQIMALRPAAVQQQSSAGQSLQNLIRFHLPGELVARAPAGVGASATRMVLTAPTGTGQTVIDLPSDLLDPLHWSQPFLGGELLAVGAHDGVKLLVGQVVYPGPRSMPDGVLRLGLLEPSNGKTAWLGHCGVPVEFPGNHRNGRLFIHGDDAGWLVVLISTRSAPGSAMGTNPWQWSTLIPYPEGHATDRRGWLARALPPPTVPEGPQR